MKKNSGNVSAKPFYKKVWFWVVAVLLVGAIGSSMDGKDSGKTSNDKKIAQTKKKDNSDSSKKKQVEKKAATSSKKSDKITRSQIDAIKVGDLLSDGNGGDSLSDLKARFGEPASTSSSTTNGVKTDILTWDNVEGGWGVSLTVGFTNGHVFDKNLVGFKLARQKKISLADFNALQTGMSYKDFTAKMGEPDYYHESNIGGQVTNIAGYTSGVKGDIGANFNATFVNGSLQSKSQSSMK